MLHRSHSFALNAITRAPCRYNDGQQVLCQASWRCAYQANLPAKLRNWRSGETKSSFLLFAFEMLCCAGPLAERCYHNPRDVFPRCMDCSRAGIGFLYTVNGAVLYRFYCWRRIWTLIGVRRDDPGIALGCWMEKFASWQWSLDILEAAKSTVSTTGDDSRHCRRESR